MPSPTRSTCSSSPPPRACRSRLRIRSSRGARRRRWGRRSRRPTEPPSAGRARADALGDQLAPLGERAHALADVLRDHLRYGVPLLPALERTSLELRLDRRRAAEVEARRVPVRLLFPLVTCVLPAFALLTVVPLLAASLDALPT